MITKRFFCKNPFLIVFLISHEHMKNKSIFFVFFLLVFMSNYAQEVLLDSLQVTDLKYREDQFYAGVGYNLLANKPKDLSQSGFSTFINVGVIRDFPINEKRNFGFGLGLGYAYNSLNQNMLIGNDITGEREYIILSGSGINYSKNKFEMHLLEFPFEIRWRTSTPLKHDFVRIYFGLKAGYVFATRSVFKSEEGNQGYKNIKDFNAMQYGLTLSAGYNTWNIHLYYGLTPIFEDGTVTSEGDAIKMKSVRIGLIFYFL